MSAKLDDFDTPEQAGPANLSLNEMKLKIPTFSSDKLCEIIVCERYFGSFKELAIMSMEELGNRRLKGDNFDFESYIELSLKDLPKLDMSVPNIGNVIRQFAGKMVTGK